MRVGNENGLLLMQEKLATFKARTACSMPTFGNPIWGLFGALGRQSGT